MAKNIRGKGALARANLLGKRFFRNSGTERKRERERVGQEVGGRVSSYGEKFYIIRSRFEDRNFEKSRRNLQTLARLRVR